jgi:hypothetical protein
MSLGIAPVALQAIPSASPSGRQVRAAASRSQRTIESLVNAFGKRARARDLRDPGKRQGVLLRR